MKFFTIFPLYIYWHYTSALKNYFTLWKTSFWFFAHFFSIKILLKTFFAPYKRLKENYKGGLDLEDFFESLVTTTIMRIVGMIIRSALIILGLISLLCVLILGFFGFFVWLFLPFITIFLFGLSLVALSK